MRPLLRFLSLKGEENATKTWRYLRLGMVALVLGLAASVLYEFSKVECGFKTSISAYYYTPVHGYFMAALLAIGVALFCLKGNTELEDILLNLAGLFAPVVALVPTPNAGECASKAIGTVGRAESIANNMTALFVIAAFALLAIALLSLKSFLSAPRTVPTVPSVVGFCAAVLLLVVAVLAFGDRTWFDENAHDVAAYSMFGCIFLVVIINAITAIATRHRVAGPAYGIIAVAMLVTLVVTFLLERDGYSHWVFFVEAVLITLFAAFWIVQTSELWAEGLRTPLENAGADPGRST